MGGGRGQGQEEGKTGHAASMAARQTSVIEQEHERKSQQSVSAALPRAGSAIQHWNARHPRRRWRRKEPRQSRAERPGARRQQADESRSGRQAAYARMLFALQRLHQTQHVARHIRSYGMLNPMRL
jgi:hypothetical protein